MASIRLLIYISLLFLSFLFMSDALGLQKCIPLQKGPFSKCSLAGYNYTFPLPSSLSKRSLRSIKSIVRHMISSVQNCSVGAISETMACAIVAPNCEELSHEPLLPCKRVCSEFLRRCESSIPDFFVHVLVALCSLLPNDSKSDGTCYEPPNFEAYYNSSRLGPLERACSPVIIPFCQNIGYTHSIITYERQKQFYKHLYGKKYTKDSNVANPHPNSGAQTLINITKNLSRCAVNVKKLYCAEYVPPCFEQEGPAYYTACQDVCKNVITECKEVFNTQLRFFFYCEKLAYGDPYKGFCKHRSWPPPMKWIDIFKDHRPWPKKPPKHTGVGGGAMAAIIIGPIVVVGAILAIVFFYKKRRHASKGYARQKDDKVELVT